jgi:hypothetical protein
MSSCDDEDVSGTLAWLNLMNAQNQVRRRFWVHPYWRENSSEHDAYKIFKELNIYPPSGAHVSGFGKWRSRGTRDTQCPGVLLGNPVSRGINTETWSSTLGVGHKADNLTL